MQKERKQKKYLKLLLVTIIVSVFIGLAITIGIGNYFVNYALLRAGDGGNRKVTNTEAIEAVNQDDEAAGQIDKNRRETKELAKAWSETAESKKVEVRAADGILLRGTEYFTGGQGNQWAIVLHGYRANPESVLSIGMRFSEKGYHVLIPNMRACGESEGDYIGMGWLDKDDLKCWINLIMAQDATAEIVLHGSSMGAATVLMASGDVLPTNVKAIIEDSGYTSVWDIFASEAKVRFNLPTFPVLDAFKLVANIRAKYDIKEASAIEQVRKATVPILFIHGDADDFVPEYMCEALYEAANCKKEKLIIHNAGHTESRDKDPDAYYNKIFEFIEDVR